MESITSFFSYLWAALLTLGGFIANDAALGGGLTLGVATFIINWVYKQKNYRLSQQVAEFKSYTSNNKQEKKSS